MTDKKYRPEVLEFAKEVAALERKYGLIIEADNSFTCDYITPAPDRHPGWDYSLGNLSDLLDLYRDELTGN